MPQHKYINELDPQKKQDLGEINITTNVLETIATKATREVEGVYKLQGGVFANRSGAKLHYDDLGMTIDVAIQVEYGYSIPEVAIKVQDSVKDQILFMTDLVIDQVNVHVISIETDHSGQQAFLDLDAGDALE